MVLGYLLTFSEKIPLKKEMNTIFSPNNVVLVCNPPYPTFHLYHMPIFELHTFNIAAALRSRLFPWLFLISQNYSKPEVGSRVPGMPYSSTG